MKNAKIALLLAVTNSFAILSVAHAQQKAEPDQIVTIMRDLAGKQKARPSGAKGQCLVGTFTPSADGKALSMSEAFAKPSKALIRHSVGGGNPKVGDATKAVNRGLSFKIDDGGKGQTEFVMVNAPINFVNTPDQMLGFLQARLPGADGKPDQAKITAFTQANPETTNQGKYLAGLPVAGSWAGVAYWGIHNYTLTNAAGAKQLIKIKMEPVAGLISLTEDEAKAKPADFLVDEMKARLAAKQPAGFNFVAILGGQPGDEVINLTQRWVDEDKRQTKVLGRLDITALEDNNKCDEAIFDPLNLAKGLDGPENDPLFMMRTPAYAISIGQRM